MAAVAQALAHHRDQLALALALLTLEVQAVAQAGRAGPGAGVPLDEVAVLLAEVADDVLEAGVLPFKVAVGVEEALESCRGEGLGREGGVRGEREGTEEGLALGMGYKQWCRHGVVARDAEGGMRGLDSRGLEVQLASGLHGGGELLLSVGHRS